MYTAGNSNREHKRVSTRAGRSMSEEEMERANPSVRKKKEKKKKGSASKTRLMMTDRCMYSLLSCLRAYILFVLSHPTHSVRKACEASTG